MGGDTMGTEYLNRHWTGKTSSDIREICKELTERNKEVGRKWVYNKKDYLIIKDIHGSNMFALANTCHNGNNNYTHLKQFHNIYYPCPKDFRINILSEDQREHLYSLFDVNMMKY